MLPNLLTHPLFIASIISFFLGSFGYILVRLWLRPVMRYHRAKHEIQLELDHFGIADSVRDKTSEVSKNLRRHADTLTSVYYDALPYWYRLLLEKREENPIEAATLLMRLANTRAPNHTRQQREKIKAFLKLK
ncbi:MAG: hypothetical protein V2B19_26190 [Pseudomonadota bacterium]